MAGEYFSPAQVRAVQELSTSVRLLELVPDTGVVPYPSGSHIDIAVEIDALPDTRSYSLVGDAPRAGAYRIAVKLVPESRGGSRWIHSLRPGDVVYISAPTSHFELTPSRPQYLLVAGGIGITPLIGMAQALVRAGRDLRLLYSAREADGIVFADELSALLGDRLVCCVSARGERVDLAGEIDALAPDGELLLCGPPRLRDAVRALWRARGRPPERLRFETFASGGRFPAMAFTATVADHGGTVVEVPARRTLLEALTGAGIEVLSDCRRGECGLCAVNVIACSSVIDHRDVFLSEEEQAASQILLACVSRPAGGTVSIDTGFRSPAQLPRPSPPVPTSAGGSR